jgi:hypothetical protein
MKRIDEERKPLKNQSLCGHYQQFKVAENQPNPRRGPPLVWFSRRSEQGVAGRNGRPRPKNTKNNPIQSDIFAHTKCNFWVIFLTCPWWLAAIFKPICG